MTDFLNGKIWMHSLQKLNLKKMCIKDPYTILDILGLWAVMLCDTKRCGPLAEKNKQANKKKTPQLYT